MEKFKNKSGLKEHATSDMEVFDRILERLCDLWWHSLEEIRAEFSLPEAVLYNIIRFLEEQAFIELDKDKNAVRIKPLGVIFLELPILVESYSCEPL